MNKGIDTRIYNLCDVDATSESGQVDNLLLGSLSTHVFETRTTTGRGHFACQDSVVSQTFIPSISNEEKILGNANGVE